VADWGTIFSGARTTGDHIYQKPFDIVSVVRGKAAGAAEAAAAGGMQKARKTDVLNKRALHDM
jgi:hypothetical protein